MEEISKLNVISPVMKQTRFYDFPAVRLTKNCFYFNKAAHKYIKDIKAFRVFLTPDYLIFQKAATFGNSAFSLFNSKDSPSTFQMHFPKELTRANFQYGVYRLYKVTNGYAIKRYEPIKEE